ncbi:hypothetical protein PQR67_20200 [Paraburkholderia fungorum]|uniref:hypothetical protein n=1 Tax=Paraburkholderia fungorum TaxID=134537 RepID=UPI0038BB864E
MSFSAIVVVLICACCWIAVVIAKTGLMREKRGVQDQHRDQQQNPRGQQILREALDKHKRDVPDVRNVREVRDVRAVSLLKNLKTRRDRRE